MSSSTSPPTTLSSNQRGQQQQQQQQPVIQTLMESFTRCFNPLNHHSGCTKIINGGCGSDDEEVDVVRRSSSFRDGELSSSGSRAVSRTSTSSSEARKKKQRGDGDNRNNQSNTMVAFDDDAIRRQSSHRKLSGEYLEERSMKRKLEIFRCDGATARLPAKLKPRQGTSTGHARNNSTTPRDRSSPQSSSSSDDEDLIRLAQSSSRERFSCGINLNHDSPISNVARFLNMGLIEAQKPFGLCFATPVRASSREDVSKLSDDRLTAEEFFQRHPHDAATTTFLNANEITPDRNHHNNVGSNNNATAADSSYNEDETITSTLYFDHKYSHLVQTRPPMPLFREDMLNSGDGDGNYCGDELSEIIKRRSSSLERRDNVEPPAFPTVEAVTNWRHRNPTPRNRGLFLESSEGCGEGKKEEYPSPAKKAHAYTGFVDIHGKNKDGPGSPIRIRDESMSTSTADSAEEYGS